MPGSAPMGLNRATLPRLLLKSCCWLLLCLLLAACGDQGDTDGKKPGSTAFVPESGGVYSIPLLNSPKSLDPVKAEDQYSAAVVYQLFDGLVRFSPDLLVIPALAENWRIEQGGLAYRFFLRKDAFFHNGKPVTSADVLFSISRLLRSEPAPSVLPHMLRIVGAREYRAGEADNLAGVEIVNPRELQIRLQEPYAPFLAALGMHQTRIVPGEEVSAKGDAFSRNPTGSGAFRFSSWEPGGALSLKRFSEYYLGPSLLDEIRYIIYPGGRIDEAMADFKQKKLQEMPVYGKVRKELLSRKDIKSLHRPSLSLLFYGVNCRDPLLGRPEVRRALSLAIDREELVSEVYDRQFEPAGSFLPPGILGYNPEQRAVRDNPDSAQAMLKQALGEESGGGVSIEIVSAVESSIAKAELEFIAKAWEKIGVTLKIKFIPNWSEFEKYIQSPSMQLYRYAWFMDIPDPDNIMQVLFGSDSNVNYMHYRNPGADELLRVARTVFEPGERAAIYQKIQQLAAEDMPIIPLVHLSIDQVYQPNVQGIQLNALGVHKSPLHQVWLSRERDR